MGVLTGKGDRLLNKRGGSVGKGGGHHRPCLKPLAEIHRKLDLSRPSPAINNPAPGAFILPHPVQLSVSSVPT